MNGMQKKVRSRKLFCLWCLLLGWIAACVFSSERFSASAAATGRDSGVGEGARGGKDSNWKKKIGKFLDQYLEHPESFLEDVKQQASTAIDNAVISSFSGENIREARRLWNDALDRLPPDLSKEIGRAFLKDTDLANVDSVEITKRIWEKILLQLVKQDTLEEVQSVLKSTERIILHLFNEQLQKIQHANGSAQGGGNDGDDVTGDDEFIGGYVTGGDERAAALSPSEMEEAAMRTMEEVNALVCDVTAACEAIHRPITRILHVTIWREPRSGAAHRAKERSTHMDSSASAGSEEPWYRWYEEKAELAFRVRAVPRFVHSVSASLLHGYDPSSSPFLAALIIAYSSGDLSKQLAMSILDGLSQALEQEKGQPSKSQRQQQHLNGKGDDSSMTGLHGKHEEEKQTATTFNRLFATGDSEGENCRAVGRTIYRFLDTVKQALDGGSNREDAVGGGGQNREADETNERRVAVPAVPLSAEVGLSELGYGDWTALLAARAIQQGWRRGPWATGSVVLMVMGLLLFALWKLVYVCFKLLSLLVANTVSLVRKRAAEGQRKSSPQSSSALSKVSKKEQ